MGQKLRPPIDLHQRQTYDGVTCMVAQVMHVFGLIKGRPDLRAIDLAARKLSTEPALSDADAYLYLLGQGFRLTGITSYDPQRFLREGVGYLRERYGREWGPEHEAHFTAVEVRHLQEAAQQYEAHAGIHQEQKRLLLVRRQANRQDIGTLLRGGWIVDMTAELGHRGRVQQAGLLIPDVRYTDCSKVWLYVPCPPRYGSTVSSVSLAEACNRVRYDRGVTGISR